MAEVEKKSIKPKKATEEGEKKKNPLRGNKRFPRNRKFGKVTKRKTKAPKKEKEAPKEPVDEATKKKQQSLRDKTKHRLAVLKEKRKYSKQTLLLQKINTAVQREESAKKKKAALEEILKRSRDEKKSKKEKKGKAKKDKAGKSKKKVKKFGRQRRYVQIGTVVNILHGSSRNTLAVIVDILDNHWVMIDGKCFNQDKLGKPSERRMMNLNDLQVTPFRVKKVSYRMSASKIAKLAKRQGIMKRWKGTTTYSTIQKRRNKRWSTDLERWRVMYNHKQRSALIKAEFLKLKRKVLELAAAATRGQGKFTKRLNRRGLLAPEREYLRRFRMEPWKPKPTTKKVQDHPLELIPKPEKPTKPKVEKPAAKPKPAAKKGKDAKAKAKPKAKTTAKPSAAKPAAAKPSAAKPSGAKPAAKKAKPAAK